MFVIFLLIFSRDFRTSAKDDYNPTIRSHEGHLYLETFGDKHIYLQTDGQGSIHINKVDLKNVTELASSVSNALIKYKTNFEVTLEKLHNLDTYLGQAKNNTNSSATSPYSINIPAAIRRLNRRVTQLSRRLQIFITDLQTDSCKSTPCRNGGTCQPLFKGFHCLCPKEWQGTTCEVDVNECQTLAGTDLGCQNGATCINKPGTYQCDCAAGWYGIHCTRRSNDCSSGTNAEICGHGTCIPQNDNKNPFKCLCDQGWTTNGITPICNTDVNECNDKKPPCSVNPLVPCINTPGSFQCGECPAGYTGNGHYCADINECLENNGGCSTTPMVLCINTLGSFQCGLCPAGYAGDGKTCSYQGVCNVNNGGCHPLATCSENPRISSSFVTCTCRPGYTGNGIGPTGCIPGSDPCTPNPCNNGDCVLNRITGYECKCPRTRTGRNCEKFTNLCTPNPCLNNGTCISFVGTLYSCRCPPNFTGVRCQTQVQSCGGRLTAENGTLTFPMLQEQYAHGTSCAWLIETNASKVLNITFSKFNVENSHECQYDWLQIHDGKNTLAKTFGRFCGNKLPKNGTIISTHNIVYLWFRSDHTVSDGGFQLNWTSINPVCGEEIETTTFGSIQSPGSPGNYPNNRDCYWHLRAPFGKRILFHFFTLMIGDNANCDADYLEFSSSDPVLDVFAKFCNTSHPEPVYSPDNEVTIHFHSDSANTYPGFQITYSLDNGIPGCGGIFTAARGEIRSPTVDGKYPPNLLCEYKIKVKNKYRIKMTFLSFAIEPTKNCKFDSVSIYSGGNKESGLIGRYCGETLPPPYISTENEILIVLKTDWVTNHNGFVLNYEVICGEKFIEANGTISSPGYPNPSDPVECVYEIVEPLGTIIELEIKDFYLADSCGFSWLEIRDGDNENSTLIGKYCATYPKKILSKYNYLWLKFVNTDMISVPGFQATYKTRKLGCGGILKDKIGTISSHSDSKHYAPFTNCKWIISAPVGQVIQISFMMFHLEQSRDCSYDYVEVFNNNTESDVGESIGKFCGHTTPPLLLSTSNILTVNFVSDGNVGADGFLLTYNFLNENSVCGGNYYTSAGYIKSPDYPNNYPLNMECTWTIIVPAGQQIRLNVTDFQMESYSNCRYDWIEIHNGGTVSSPLIGRYCGTNIPKIIPSHTNKLTIHFKSDLTKSERGFKISWDSTITGCGGVLTAPTGAIISPNYPDAYYPNSECVWMISVSAGSAIQLIFSDLDLEMHALCLMDYVEIFDGSDMNSNLLGRYCHTHPNYLNSTSNHVTVKFRSDVSQQGRGFQLQYHTLCNITLQGFSGVIESPNFPNNYPFNLNCNWYINVDSRNKINITFSHFDIESLSLDFHGPTKQCLYDYVKIKQQPYIEAYGEPQPYNTYGTFCGKSVPDMISLNSDHALIQFVSDNMLHGSGFRIEWVLSGCGGVLTRPTGTISSPNYPHKYPSFIECNWMIQVEFGKSIEIVFYDIDVEKDTSCDYDHVSVFNGEDDTYPVITKLCHLKKPVTVRSTGNFMAVKFKSDHSFEGRGLYANYTIKDTKCGGTFTASSGSIYSPNYPKNYETLDTCGYNIEVGEGHTIKLNVEDFDLASLPGLNCTAKNHSYVTVHNGPSAAFPLLGKLCGKNNTNITFESTYNHMYIEFVNNLQQTAKGFRLKYSQSCGSRITASSTGTISYDYYAFSDQVCEWTIISSDPSQHVTLMVTSFDILYEGVCEYDVDKPLTIYNGESDNSPVMVEYCLNKIYPAVTSTGRALHIKTQSLLNFHATYSVFDNACGGELKSAQGTFASPGYPKKYPVNTQCEWNILAPVGMTLHLNFEEFKMFESEHCNTDYLELRSGNSSGKVLGIFCGDTVPTNITTVGGLWVLFKTSNPDTLDGLKGFIAEYVVLQTNELYGSQGIIESPSYIYSSVISYEFTWIVTVATQKRILITFKDLNIFNYGDECYTKLVIYDGEDDTNPLLAEYCGYTLPPSVYSSSNVICIKTSGFFSSATNPMLFRLEWLEVANLPVGKIGNAQKLNCTNNPIINLAELKNYTVITSPNYPNGYAINLDCEWILETDSSRHLRISFDRMDLDHYGFCYGDYVQISQKRKTSDWELVGKYCWDNSTLNSIEATNMVKIAFHSNNYWNGTGFSATVREECGGTMSDQNGFIVYNNATRSIVHRMYQTFCEWNITVRAGKTIKVKFHQLQIKQDDDKCSNYIMLRNGRYKDSPVLGDGKYCGNTVPNELTTVGNSLYVKFKGQVMSTNFIIEYTEVGVDCKHKIHLEDYANSTEISTPNYPNIPPPFTECTWLIMAPPGKTIRIDFIDRFDLIVRPKCDNEYVEIRDGGSVLSKLLGDQRYCQAAPNSQISSDYMMFVKYFSQEEDPGNGFKAMVSIAKCGGTLRGREGTIQSPNFNQPEKYPLNYNCTWKFVAPKLHTLTITFKLLDLPNTENCADSLTISEKNELDEEEVLTKFCGSNSSLPEFKSSGNEVFIHFTSSSTKQKHKGFLISFNASITACGGTIKAPEGFIQSPGYPRSTPVFRRCQWFIEVPKGRRVTLDFIDYDVGSNMDMSNVLSFYNREMYGFLTGSYYSGPPMKKISSSENTMLIYYWTHISSNRRGFKATFNSNLPSICRGSFNESFGTLSNPIENITSYVCTYERQSSDKSTTLAVNVKTEGTQPRFTCSSYRATVIFYGIDDKQLKYFCSGTQTTLRSPFTKNTIRFIQNYKMNFTYEATYTTYPCGGVISGVSSGTISTPNFPTKYNDNLECVWLVKLPEGQQIQLTFKQLQLGDDCSQNYLEIYNGDSPSKPRIGHYCAKQKPNTVTSESNTFWIEYKYVKESNGIGFEIDFEPSIKGCGGLFHDKSLIIETPEYPQPYPDNAECVWELQSPPGFHIGLSFIGRFEIEKSSNCSNDFLEIWDWKNDNYVSVGRFCGREMQIINSTSNKMKVMFRSNDRIVGSGFKAKWEWNCGGTFVASDIEQYIYSPHYPEPYPKSFVCEYNITAPIGKFATIRFDDFNLEGPIKNCKFDNLTISSVYYSNARPPYQMKTYCSNDKPPTTRLQGTSYIRFKTDPYVSMRGFKFAYHIENCNGEITQPTEISSPILNQARHTLYSSSMSCQWNVTAPKDKIIVVQFTMFEMPFHRTCYYDNVEVFDKTKKIANLCGDLSQNPPTIYSSGNTMRIKANLDRASNARGFKANIFFADGPNGGCGGEKTVYPNATLEIIPPNKNEIHCFWVILAPPDHFIQIHFDELNLKGTCQSYNQSFSGCACSRIEITDGLKVQDEPFERLCNITVKNFKRNVITSGNQAKISLFGRFLVDRTFKATITAVPSPCGPSSLIATQEVKKLYSPNFPNNYPGNVKCRWFISGLKKVQIRFIEFNMEKTENCDGDRLEFVDTNPFAFGPISYLPEATVIGYKKNETNFEAFSPVLGSYRFCGSINHTFDYVSNDKSLALLLHSSSSSTPSRKFHLEYHLISCSRNYTASQGQIALERATNCHIFINVEPGNTISIYFERFMIQSTANCEDAGLLIRNGGSNDAPSLFRDCGYTLPNPIFSTSNIVHIETWFKASYSGYGVNARLYYTSTSEGKGCGGKMYNYRGRFSSPMYPFAYKINKDCFWEVRVPAGMRVALKFDSFEIQGDCATNFIEVNTQGSLHKYCKDDSPATLYGDESLTVKYSSSTQNNGRGFLAIFEAVH